MKIHFLFLRFICIAFFPVVLFSQSQYNPAHQYSPTQLREDLSILKNNLETVHSGLYAYTKKEDFDRFFDSLDYSFSEPMTDLDFYRSIFPLSTLIRNGHTGIIPAKNFTSLVSTKFSLLPFDVIWDEGKLYIYQNLSDDETLLQGSIIQSINGEEAGNVFREISGKLSRDGFNTSLPEVNAAMSFKVLYIYLKDRPEFYTLEILTPRGDILKVEIPGKSLNEIKEIRNSRYGVKPSFWSDPGIPALELDIEGDVATMKIRAFDKKFVKKQKKQKFKKFYKESFEKIEAAGVNHLILDLRDNGGGDPMPTIELFAHLHPEPFTFYKEVHSQVKKIPNKKLYEIDFFSKLAHPLIFKKKGDIYHPNWLARLLGLKGLKESKPNKPYFDKDVYVLTNPASFSATGEVTGLIKNYKRATFIGEEAGGNAVQNTSGVTFVLELPNTKTRIVMPFWLWVMNVDFENTGHGVIPDHLVKPSFRDIVEGRDPVMEYTLDLIKKSNR